jgi:hypothetical protein
VQQEDDELLVEVKDDAQELELCVRKDREDKGETQATGWTI